jgi:segregation and condensation protein A
MNQPTNYSIKVDQFEGPFDLLLFFIERDEMDIYNIQITKIINDFLHFIQEQEKVNIELSSEFILFVSTLMRIKAKLLLPRKELDALGNEIDPRQELIDKILEYKKYKEAAVQMADLEAIRMLMMKRGNIQQEMSLVGEEAAEGTELQTVTLFKLMKSFEKVMTRLQDRQNKPVHTVVRYNYTMEGSRAYLLDIVREGKTVAFEKVFDICQDRVHALFLFLSILELSQQKYMKLMVGEGRNNFIIEWNENREDDLEPGHVDNFDSYETPNLASFKDDPIQEEKSKEENYGDFDPSLN